MSLNLEITAEGYSPNDLDKMPIVAYESTLNVLLEETKKLCKGEINKRSVYIEGYYGSGKTMFLRKLAHLAVNQIENVVPIYVYLGSDGIGLGDVYDSYVDIIKEYTNSGKVTLPEGRVKIVGKPESWKNKIDVMENVRQYIKSLKGKLSVEAFYEGMRKLNKEAFYPMLILDEFERLIYTGEGIRKATEIGKDAYKEAGYFFGKYLELTRGHIFSGVIIVTSTRDVLELLKIAISEGRTEHLKGIGEQLGLDLVGHPEYFPMVQGNVAYDYNIKLRWGEDKMIQLAKVLELQVNENIIRSLARILPVPRALLNLVKLAQTKGMTLNSEKDLYGIVKEKFEELKSTLLTERTSDNRPLITVQSRWLDRFEELLKSGMWYITKNRYIEVAEAFGIPFDEKGRVKVVEQLKSLYKKGLLDKEGIGTYAINKSIFAFLLGIDRLPNGQDANKHNIILEIKTKVQEEREENRQKRSKKKEGVDEDDQKRLS